MHKLNGVYALRPLPQVTALLALSGAFLIDCAHAQPAPTSQSAKTVITCTSRQGERQVCKADTSAGVALLLSTGESSCLLGKNWGYDSVGIWVSEGCGGEFAVGSAREASGGSNFVGLFEAYGQLRTQLAVFQDDLQVQDNASRLGINFATRGKVKMIAGTEWGVNLVLSETQFNLSGSQSSPFGSLTPTSTPVFYARLGFVGVDFAQFGRVAIGKQNAMHYDIASYTTDRFNVFGGQGTQTYVAGTDGGETGTGRADRVVNYRNTFLKILDVGVQGQFRSTGDFTTTDGVASSLQVKILPGVKIGGAYTRTNWSPSTRQSIVGLGGNADYVAAGTRVDWRMLQLGFVFSHQHNGDLANVPDPTTPGGSIPVVFDANGYEVYARGDLGRLGLIAGFTAQLPDVRSPLLNPDFRTRYFILGAEWFFVKSARVYTESKIDVDSVSATGAPGFSVFTIGFRYDFSWRISHQP